MNSHVLLTVCIGFTMSDLVYSYVTESPDKCVMLFKEKPVDTHFKELQKYGWKFLDQITSRTVTFRYMNKDMSLNDAMSVVQDKFRDKIDEIEKVKEYIDFIGAGETTRRFLQQHQEDFDTANIVCEDYYGMGVEDAWANGFTGKGVVVAVTDIGINTDLKDLRKNINESLSFNIIHNTKNVTPEYFPNYKEMPATDHGNRCASLIAAEKGNDFCSAGIAYNATIAAVKMFGIELDPLMFFTETRSTESYIMARSQVHEINNIDIYSNSWVLSDEFDTLDVAMRDALKTSATEGRQGRGAIHVFPSGPYVNDLANSEYSITVSAVGQNGNIPSGALINANVLTSGLHDGNNLTAKSMVTTSYRNGDTCVSSFSGVSAATAQIAGMIALALEANTDLTRADVEDLIVYSSESTCLVEASNFITNAAGHKFHSVFGYGILNASRFVKNAANRKIRVETYSQTLHASNNRSDLEEGYIVDFCYDCSSAECFRTVKRAQIQIKYKTSANELRMTLTSPSGTLSVLQDLQSSNIDTKGSTRDQILTSVHFWDEEIVGLWIFKLHSNRQLYTKGISLTLFGINSEIERDRPNITECGTTPTANTTTSNGTPSIVLSVTIPVTTIVIVIVIVIVVYRKCLQRNTSPEKTYKTKSLKTGSGQSINIVYIG